MFQRLSILTVVLLAAFCFGSCQRTLGSRQPSRFFKEFDLAQLLLKLSNSPVECDQSWSTGQSGSAVDSEYTAFRKHSSFECRVSDQSPAIDQTALLRLLKAELEGAIKAAGATSGGAGESGSNIHCSYRDGDRYGWVEVFVVTLDGRHYRILYVINEVTTN
jgi:hypothetical protein